MVIMSFSYSYIMDLEKAIEDAEQRGLALVHARSSQSGGTATSRYQNNAVSTNQKDAGRLGYTRAASDAASTASETHDERTQLQAGGASPPFAYPTPALGVSECRGPPRTELREDSDRESSAIDNPLALRHPEFTTSAEGTSCT